MGRRNGRECSGQTRPRPEVTFELRPEAGEEAGDQKLEGKGTFRSQNCGVQSPRGMASAKVSIGGQPGRSTMRSGYGERRASPTTRPAGDNECQRHLWTRAPALWQRPV